MEIISVLDIFKIGVGPSSSHTMGPWKAALDFMSTLKEPVDSIFVHLYGSLSKTGKGHATDVAIQLGLMGFHYENIDTNQIAFYIDQLRKQKSILNAGSRISFDPEVQIVFEDEIHPLHPNTIIFKSINSDEITVESVYASVGGGFIEKQGGLESSVEKKIPYPVQTGKDVLEYIDSLQCTISELTYKNEIVFHEEKNFLNKLDGIIQTMYQSVYNGCIKEGVLPGGLDVKRRAQSICQKLCNRSTFENIDDWKDSIRKSKKDFATINQWVSCFALAVNEENAAISRIVTSPTNGAAGVIPAVLLYYRFFCDYQGYEAERKFLITAGELGCIFKKGATISAAVGGCQAEIGVSSAMAAAGLTEVLGGSPRQSLMAAEIAMEHHLGMTCDPIAGLVQIPCIERNAMGAIKAITAANLAIASEPQSAKIDIDIIIKTMWETALDMNHKYKETSEGGLALNLPVIIPNC